MVRLEGEDFEHAAAGDANPPDLVARLLVIDAEKTAHAVGRRVRHADQRTSECLPVERHRFVEIRHGDAGMAERTCLHKSCLMWSATRSACAAIVSAGLTAADEGKNDASTTKRFSTSCVRHNVFNTDDRASVPKHIVPH